MRSHSLRLTVEFIHQLVSSYLAGNRSFLSKTGTATVQHSWLVVPREKGLLALGRGCMGRAGVRLPGVLFATATFHLFTLGCEHSAEVPQVVKQLQCPVLGHWKCTFSLKMNAPPHSLREMTSMHLINSVTSWLSPSLFQKQMPFPLIPLESHNKTG